MGLQETLIIDQQIPNVNRAIRPENTDIHHPDTNCAAGPDVITGVQLNASHLPRPAPLLMVLCWCSSLRSPPWGPPGSFWPQPSSPAVLSSSEERRPMRSLCPGGGAPKVMGQICQTTDRSSPGSRFEMTCFVPLGTSLTLSESQLPPLSKGADNTVCC